MNRTRSTILSIALGVGLICGLAEAAAAAPGWSRPKTLTTMTVLGLPSVGASVAVAPNGDAVAVWINEGTGRLQYALRAAGIWGAARTLYTPSAAKGETIAEAKVVVEPNGTAVALWSSTTPGVLQYCVVGGRVVRCYGPAKSYAKAGVLAPGATAWVKSNLSPVGTGVSGMQLGMSPTQGAVAAWTYVQAAGVLPVFQAASRPLGGSWSAAQSLLTLSDPPTQSTLAVGANADAVLAWTERRTAQGTSASVIRALPYVGGAWGAAEDVAASPNLVWEVRAAVDGLGTATLVWSDAYAVLTTERTAGLWATPSVLTSGPGRSYGVSGAFLAYGPDVATDAVGNRTFAWVETETASGAWTIEAQRHLRSGSVDGISIAVLPVYGSPAPRVTMSPDGTTTMVAWIDNGAGSAYAMSHGASGWSTPLLVGPALWDSLLGLGSADGGNSSLVWIGNTAVEFRYTYLGASYLP